MTGNALTQTGFFLAALLVCAWPLGIYMARVYTDKPFGLDRVFGPVERLVYKMCGVDATKETDWKTYAVSLMLFSGLSILVLYGLQRLQGILPLNQGEFGAVPPALALNTAVSYVTNTNWQAYGGETTMTYLTQMLGLTVQNFVSAGAGMAVCAAFIRGLSRHESATVGNFWKDLVRSVLYILLPLSIILSLLLVWQGVPQTLDGPAKARLTEPVAYTQPVQSAQSAPAPGGENTSGSGVKKMEEQEIALGPVASQVAIKHLGTNGGGFFSANSAHPFENPTPFSNFLEMLAILVIPAGLCITFGVMVSDTRQGGAILAAMTLVFLLMTGVCLYFEQTGNPHMASLGLDQQFFEGISAQSGGNMEGKEVRFGVAGSALFATVTTAASCGAVNSMHDSFTPMGGFAPMLLMQLGEVIYGGVGSGLYGMLVFAVIAVFIAGLMVGRTPEYLGKKIEPFEMKMAAMVILIPPFLTLVATAAAVAGSGASSIANPGPHGFSEILYAFSSMSNNNGSAFAGLSANTAFYNVAGAACMFIARFWLAVPVLGIAGSLAAKKITPPSAGTLPTSGALFVLLLICVVFIVGALTFFPALCLGPAAEYLQMTGL